MIKGIVFDKDGCLFDFNATWGAWSRGMIDAEAQGDPTVTAQLAKALGYDMAAQVFLPTSIVIAETVGVVAERILTIVPQDRDTLLARMKDQAAVVPQVQAAPLIPLMDALSRYKLGVATNDAEAPARMNLQQAGIEDRFDFIAGYDSGYGGKPATGQLDAFCAQMGLLASDCIMVGDSLHDIEAGRAAGMRTIGVLTGPAPRSVLEPHADVVLNSVGELPSWIESDTSCR